MRAGEAALRWAAAAALGALLPALAACSKPPPPPPAPPRFATTFEWTGFRRGNVHAHTNLSDGGNRPDEVARWYRQNGYDFLFITDHNLVTDAVLAMRLSTPSFLVLPGEEVSMWHNGKQVHINALCTNETIGWGEFPSAREALVHGIRRVRAQQGVALINHPNFDSAITPKDIPAFEGAALLEIASGHPYVPSAGDRERPSHEALWDQALSAGMELMGAAVDDMHHVQQCGDPPAYPGKGWVYVPVAALNQQSICEALANRRLVSSTGPWVVRVTVKADRYEVQPGVPSDPVTFIGAGGRVLATGQGSYVLRGGEGYVRARVDAPDGTRAWMPAVKVEN
jgi:hypothetical protein